MMDLAEELGGATDAPGAEVAKELPTGEEREGVQGMAMAMEGSGEG